MSRKTMWIVVPALLTLACAVAQAQTPVGTAFTYQGQLNLNNVPVNDTADFVFRLFDASTDGAQIGTDVSVPDVSVSTGLFTVPLDFGASAFGGEARWLEIWVRSPAGGGNYTWKAACPPTAGTEPGRCMRADSVAHAPSTWRRDFSRREHLRNGIIPRSSSVRTALRLARVGLRLLASGETG